MCKKRIEIASLKVKGIKMATWDITSNIIRGPSFNFRLPKRNYRNCH